MIEELNRKIRPLLEIYEKLKDVLKIAKIGIPKIATCGMQSHGKSSTLESITKIELPTKEETCTICPIKICLKETKGNEYFNIKLEGEEYNENDKNIKNFKKLKDKIDEYQEKVKDKYKLKDQNVTEKAVIQLEVFKQNVPNLNLYDLPGVTFVEGIKKEAENIYESFLNDNDTTVLLILNGSDDLTNSSVIEWMKKAKNYKNRFIPIVAKADKIQNFDGKFKQLKNMNLNNKPCLIINKNKDFKDLSEKEEEEKIKELIPNIGQYPVNIGRKKLIEELIKIQYEKYKENFKDIIDNINKEIKNNKDRLEKLPPEYDSKEKFCPYFIDIFENLLTKFIEEIKKFIEGPKGGLLKYEIQIEYREYIKKSKEKINEFFTLEFCDYVTNNIKETNSDKISILEDEIPFQLLITPKIKEILNIFEEIIKNIYEKIKKIINKTIESNFSEFINLKNKVNDLYVNYSFSQFNKMDKFYKEICLLETSNITSFDKELNYKCNVLVRKILNFLYKTEKISLIENNNDENDIKENKKDENNINNQNKDENNENNDNNQNNKENNNEDNISTDTSDNIICDDRDAIIQGIKNINELSIKKISQLTEQTINKLTEEVKSNSNYKKNVKKKQEENKRDIMQNIGIIINYEIEQLTRIYDSLGCRGRPKLSYIPENITTFDERIEDININGKDGYEFVPGFEFIKNKNLNDFINLFKSGQVLQKTANIIIKMVAYTEVMCNRVIDFFFLGIQNYLYDNLTNDQMIKFLRNETHKLLINWSLDDCKKLLEVNPEIAEEIKVCQKNIEKLSSSLKQIEEAHSKFYKNQDNLQEKEQKLKKENEEEQNNESGDSDDEDDN